MEEADILGVSEAHEFLIMPKLPKSQAERHLRLICNDSQADGVTCWPDAVNYFPCAYATAVAIHNAAIDLRNIHQQPREDELRYGGRINVAVHSCRNVHDEIDSMTQIINGHLLSLQKIFACFLESKGHRRLSNAELVQYVQGKGKSHQARIA